MNNFKRRTSYVLIGLMVITYVLFKGQTYKVSIENNTIRTEIEEVQKENSDLKVKLNTQRSRNDLTEKDSDFEIHDNIYHLGSDV